MDKQAVGQRLAALRGSRTLAQVAKEISVSEGALCQYEKGVRTPKDDIKVRLAKFYGCTVGWLFFGEG